MASSLGEATVVCCCSGHHHSGGGEDFVVVETCLRMVEDRTLCLTSAGVELNVHDVVASSPIEDTGMSPAGKKDDT